MFSDRPTRPAAGETHQGTSRLGTRGAETERPRYARGLTFVLPLATSDTGRDEQDLERARLLLATMCRFFDASGLVDFFVLAPPRDLVAVRRLIAPFASRLSVKVVNEVDVCPELATNPQSVNLWPRKNTGWFRQQLLKLAIYEHVSTDFYMVLDADVVFVRDFGVDTLLRGERALIGTLTTADFERFFVRDVAAHEVGVRRTRMHQAAEVLRLERPSRYHAHWYAETPVLLSRNIVRELTEHITNTWAVPWRTACLEKLPWTEYALYFLFAEARGYLERFHELGHSDSVLRLSQSLWRPPEDHIVPRSLSNWDPGQAFAHSGAGIAVVIQSYLGYSAQDVESLVKPHLGEARTHEV